MTKKAQIVSAFPGVGKTHFFNNANVEVLDSDSSLFSWSKPGVRNPNFPQNYIEHILVNRESADYILVSSHKEVREALEENGIDYTLVFPSIKLKAEYLKRFKERGSPQAFIDFIDANWIEFITEMEEDPFPSTVTLLTGDMYLSDVFDTEKKPKYEKMNLRLGSTIDEAVEQLLHHQSQGKLVYVKFNDITLYSDTVTLDDAYLQITGKPKADFDALGKNSIK